MQDSVHDRAILLLLHGDALRVKERGRHLPEVDGQSVSAMLGRNVQAYVDNMVVTSHSKEQHVADLEELFTTIAKYRL